MRQISKIIAVLLLVVLASMGAAASSSTDWEQNQQSQAETIEPTSHSPRAVRRLLEYLSEPPEEQATLLLGYAEVRNDMMMDYCWEPYDEEHRLADFAQRKGIDLEEQGERAYRLTGLTVDELSDKLRHQVIKKTDQDHCHDWMYFDVTDEEGGEKLFRHCQSCQKWQAFEAE